MCSTLTPNAEERKSVGDRGGNDVWFWGAAEVDGLAGSHVSVYRSNMTFINSASCVDFDRYGNECQQ